MRTRLCIAASLAAVSVASPASALVQQRARSSPAAAAATPTPATQLPTPTNRNIAISPVYLPREAIQGAAGALSAADKGKSKRAGILRSLEKTVEGDKHVIEAAKSVLAATAQSLAQNGSATIVVVIGGEQDLAKVVESLSRVERAVRIAYVDRSFEDATYDNTALNSGLIGGVKNAADNMWVYMPRGTSTPRSKPDRVLSTKVASATLWNGLFAADGDAIDVEQLKSLRGADSSHSTSDAEVTISGGPAIGDVVSPKISNVKVLADASADSKVLGTVAKTDELVVASAPKNGFVMVEGASVKGWVSLTLLSKR